MPPPKRKSSGAGRKTRKSAREATPLHEMQQRLAEEQARLNRRKAHFEQIIADAPRRAEEEERRQREELIARASQGARRMDASGSLVDKRYDAHTFAPTKTKGLRMHRRAARLQFFALCVLLVVLVIVVLRHIP